MRSISIIFIFVIFVLPNILYADTTRFSIVYTGGVMAEIEPCG